MLIAIHYFYLKELRKRANRINLYKTSINFSIMFVHKFYPVLQNVHFSYKL